MSLVVRNLQRAVPVRRAPLRKRAEQLRCILGVQSFDLGLICVSNRHIQRLNGTYRQKNIPTDVLSFPFHENLKAGELPQPCAQDEYNLGDIFLGVEYIYQQCVENKEDYNSILTVSTCLPGLYSTLESMDCSEIESYAAACSVLEVTIAHGLCHLLGYKHSTEAEWPQMYQKEAQILQELNKLLGTNLQPLTKNLF